MEHISDALKERNIILETNDPVVADGFTQVPNFILKNDALTVGEKITFAMFLTYAWNNDKVFPGQERLAKDRVRGVGNSAPHRPRILPRDKSVRPTPPLARRTSSLPRLPAASIVHQAP